MEALPQDLADFLVTKNFDPEYFDKKGDPSEAGKATTIKFDYVAASGKNYGTAVCVISNDELSLYYGDNLGRGMEPEDKDEWYSFLEQLSNQAASHSATWSPTEINKLKHNLAGIAAIKEGLFEGYYGNRRVSYMGEQTQARLVINHNRVLGEEDKRFRYVESLFIETADQERFRLPFKSLAGGRAMLEHVRQGGRPYDIRGNHITEIVSEMAVLSRFNRAQHNRVFEGVTQELVESARQYYHNLQETMKHLGSSRGYQAYFESWAPDHVGEAEALVENLRDLFVEQTLDARIEAALPTLAKIQQQGNNMKEAQIFENWINNLSEGTWALPETPEQMEKLNQLMSAELIVGPDATNATELLYDIVGDDELFDILNDLADKSQGRANIWDDSDVQRRLAELGVQTPQSTQAEPADVPQDTAPPVKESADANKIWSQYGHYSKEDLMQEFPELTPKDAQTIVNYSQYAWDFVKSGATKQPEFINAKNQVVQRVQQAMGGQQGVAEGNFKQTPGQRQYGALHSQLQSLANSGQINTPDGKQKAEKMIDTIQQLVDTDPSCAGSTVPSKKIWLSEQGMAEDSSENKYSNLSNRGVNRGINRAADDFNRMLDLDQAESPHYKTQHQQDTKQRLKTKPMAGPKGMLPEQGVAEGDNMATFVEDRELAEMLKYAGVPVQEGVLKDDTGNTFDHLLDRFPHEVETFKQTGKLDDDLYDALFDYYSRHGAMPYRVRNAKDDTANRWVSKHLSDDLGLDEGLGGAIAGGLAGAGLGSIVPALGTVAGGIAGAYAGHKIQQQGLSDPDKQYKSPEPKKPVSEGSCNMTMEGSYCPEHGLAECGSMYEDGGDSQITPGMKTKYGTVVSVDGNTVTVKASNGELTTMNIHDIQQAMDEDGGAVGMPYSMGEDNDILSMHNKMKEGTVGQLAGGTLGALGGATVGTALGGPIGGAIGTAFGGTAGQMGGDKLGDKIGAVVGEESPTAAVVKGAAKAATQGLGDVVGGGGKDILKNLLAIESDDPINSNSAMTGSYYEGKETDIQEGDALLARIKSLALLR